MRCNTKVITTAGMAAMTPVAAIDPQSNPWSEKNLAAINGYVRALSKVNTKAKKNSFQEKMAQNDAAVAE